MPGTDAVAGVDLSRLLAALMTPYDTSGAVAYDKLSALVRAYVAKGVEGLFVCGTGGESLLLSLEEREKILDVVISSVEDAVPVVAHIGALNTADSVKLAQHAQNAGAQAVSAIPPVYFAYQRGEIVRHYTAIMDSCDLPMVLYNIPSLTGIEFSADWSELFDDSRVVAVKHTSTNLSVLTQCHAAYPDKTYLSGLDDLFLPAMLCGASGAIGVTVGPCLELFQAVRRNMVNGDTASAERAQALLTDVINTLSQINLYPAAKYLAERDMPSLGGCRPPFRSLTDQERNTLDQLNLKLDGWLSEVADA